MAPRIQTVMAFCIVVLGSASAMAPQGAAQDLCTGIETAIRHASQNFSTLKGERAWEGAYVAEIVIPGAHECHVIEDSPPDIKYDCRMTRYELTVEEAFAEFTRETPYVAQCLPETVKFEERGRTVGVERIWAGVAPNVDVVLEFVPLSQAQVFGDANWTALVVVRRNAL